MIARLFRKSASAASRVPDGQRVYAIGDVHGCLTQLDMLLAMIDADDAARATARTTLIFIGDLIDRGPDSRGVVDRVMRLAASGGDVRLLMGNHEEILLRAAEGDRDMLGLFDRAGGRETLLSYGVAPTAYDDASREEVSRLIRAVVPDDHLRFMAEGGDVERIGDYTFVHAGIRPGVPVDAQQATDLRWIREPFLSHRASHGTVVVHGHTITDTPVLRDNRIGIDTGAYAGGKLTAIGMEGDERWVLQA